MVMRCGSHKPVSKDVMGSFPTPATKNDPKTLDQKHFVIKAYSHSLLIS